jgi:hypothetical protein
MRFPLPVRKSHTLARSWRAARSSLPWMIALVGLGAAFESAGGGAEGTKPAEKTAVSQAPRGVRLREGTELLDQPGQFEISGDRVIFVAASGGARMVGLENLGLERIARTLANNSGRLQWKVTGVVTEFRGTNYLLVRRAVLRLAGDRRDPSGGGD